MIVHLLFAVIFGQYSVFSQGTTDPSTDSSRIVGGSPTTIEQYPYQVSLQFKGSHICGGSIIGHKWVLTAAHCIGDYDKPSDYAVRTGSAFHNHGGSLHMINQIIVHENFSVSTFDNDITAIELAMPLHYNVHTVPIPLAPKTSNIYSGNTVTVTGWGRLSSFGFVPKLLRKVEVPLVGWEECAKAYMEHPITERMICAGDRKLGGKDACQGDSGGPLAFNGKLIGIVSWGFGCAEPSYPGVYTRVAAFRDWIQSKTGI